MTSNSWINIAPYLSTKSGHTSGRFIRINDIEFIDSQIISDKKYLYEIFTINLVFGAEYNYEYDPEQLSVARGPEGEPTRAIKRLRV